jgi:hypothetical protein
VTDGFDRRGSHGLFIVIFTRPDIAYGVALE